MKGFTTFVVIWVYFCGSVLAAPSQLVLLEEKSFDRKSACFYDGNYYPANSSFITKDCLTQCYCMGDGAASCMDLCTPIPRGECPPGMKNKKERQVSDSGEKSCYCSYCAPAFCYTAKNEKYKIGESFDRGNCAERCTCSEEGRFVCSPLCPKLKCSRGFRVKTVGIAQTSSGCMCQRKRCVKKRRRVCKVNGRAYRHRRVFVTDNCQSKCRCKRNGSARCSPLCPRVNMPRCGSNERLVDRHLPIALARGRCFCVRRICIPTVTTIQNKHPQRKPKIMDCQLANGARLPAGQRFTSSNCSERCRCTLSGYLVCVPLCSRLPVWCSAHEDRVTVSKKIRGSHCFCSRTVCRPKKVKRKVMCTVDGQTFGQDTAFVDKNCTKTCICSKYGVTGCTALCPPALSSAICHHGLRLIRRVQVPMAPWCSCTKVECVAFEDNKTEIKEES